MKKLSIILIGILTMTVLFCSTVLAASEKGENMNSSTWKINTLVVDVPAYMPSKINIDKNKKDPKFGPKLLTAEEIQKVAQEVADGEKLPYKVVLAPNKGDAYAKITIANDSRIAMFVDVYSSKNNEWLYTYQIVNGGTDMDNLDNYKLMFHKFFRSLNIQMQDNAKALKAKNK